MSQKLIDTYKEILSSERIAEPVMKKLKLLDINITFGEYSKYMRFSSANGTEVINVCATNINPKISSELVNITMEVFTDEIQNIMNVENVSILNIAKTPKLPSSPSKIKNGLIGLLAGLIVSTIAIIRDIIVNNNIKDEDQVRQYLNCPVIGVIPYYKEEDHYFTHDRNINEGDSNDNI